MSRKKSPALTSPGKVGFLVALLLVVTALGVSYFITGTFGLQWNWIELAGASPSEWHFDLGAFLEEMVPLIALVGLLAFASYMLVAGAVRRYQASVSTGAEYRELLRSFKNLDDFEDENRLDELKQHPELREFVMGFKNRVAAKERQLEEREKRQKEGPSRAPAASSSERGNGNFASESATLLSAIVESKNGFTDSVSLTIPELKQIERAVRERINNQKPITDDSAKRELESLKASVDTTLAAVRNAAAAARRDAGSCVGGARDVEAALASLQQAIDALAVPATAANGVAAAAKRVDAVAESIASLGEETKRIAIAAALSASGGAGEGDAIKVAEEIRSIATRFNGVAQQWRETSPAIRSAIDTIASSAVGAEKRRAAASNALESVVAKTRLWGERLVALTEAVNGLDRAAGGTAKAAPAAAKPAPAPAAKPAASAAPAAEEWGNLAASLEESVESNEPIGMRHEHNVTPDDEFVPQRAASVFEESGDEAPFADIPGFEKEKNLFTDEAGRKTAHHAHETDPRFVVEREAGGEWDLSVGTQAAETAGVVDASHAPSAKTPAPAPAAPKKPLEDDGFLTGPGEQEAPAKPAPAKQAKLGRRIKVDDIAAEPAPAKPAPAAKPTPAAKPAPVDPDADALDLYAVGAVDFVAGVHA